MMQNRINNIVSNKLKLNEKLVWVLDKNTDFGYSDGLESEQYLRNVLSNASDISSNSYELESYIKDWNSEYHLSRKRAQLLKGFEFDRSKKVLEVGCGCGAITRFLGEKFDDVVAIEGSIARAEIARIRTKDLNNVSIICAPFQEIHFQEKFDLIFCIGVFEYSNMFVNSVEPYDYILKYFNEILNPGGEVIIAIENQFGLKYFSSSTEDHSAVMFDGIEGYTRFSNQNARTFGYNELKNLIKEHFNSIDFYFPFPDYKMPSCIVSEDFMNKAKVAELIGGFKNTSYLDNPPVLFDEYLVLRELEKNNMLPFFSNSFLIFASKSIKLSSTLRELGLIYSDGRLEKFQTSTHFSEVDDKIFSNKKNANGQVSSDCGSLILHECESPWIDGYSISYELLSKVKNRGMGITEIFIPAKIWVEKLLSLSYEKDGKLVLHGKHVDCIWKNSFNVNGQCEFIDLEWEWTKPVKFNTLLIKSIVEFLNQIATMNDVNPILRNPSKKNLTIKIAKVLGFELSNSDFENFYLFEYEISKVVFGKTGFLLKYYIKLDLLDSRVIPAFIKFHDLFRRVYKKIFL